MVSQVFYRARMIARQLWVRAALISALAIVTAALAPVVSSFIPAKLLFKIDEDTVRSLLDILANSMLAVTTFSLTIMVTAHLTASQQVTPRAHRVLREDGRTQTVLATFIGAFVFSLTSIVMMQLDLIGQDGYALLYITTLFVVGFVIVAILRWIERLAFLGSVEETTRKIQEAATNALRNRLDAPYLGGLPIPAGGVPDEGHLVSTPTSGYVQFIDTAQLSEYVCEWGAQFFVQAMPGEWLATGDPLGVITLEDMSDDQAKCVWECFEIGDTRSFTQDVSFGISVLSEVAERALSPSTNDPRTAIDVIARLLRLFQAFDEEAVTDPPPSPGVYVPPLNSYHLAEIGFDSIARDGRGFVEVQMHIQSALSRLSEHRNADLAEAARLLSRRALAHAELGLELEADRARVTKIAVADEAAQYRKTV